MKLEFSDMCFGCGKKNECGLKLDISYFGNRAESKKIFDERFQGWDGIVHGGIITTAIDEVMAYAVGSATGKTGVTAELTIRFKKPVRIGEEYEISAEVVEFDRRKALVKGWVKRKGAVHAEGKGIYILLKEVNV